MEYSTTGTDTDYVAVTGDLTGLEPGTYYVRYAEKDNYLPSPATTVTINAGRQITITFDTQGGTEIQPITGAYNAPVEAPADPTKTGYTFTGWDTDIPATMPDKDLTIKALWSINQYTITFDTKGGNEIDPITQDYGTAVTAPENPVKDYAKFDGWDQEIPETIPADNMTITAKWIPLKEVYAVEAKCEESGNKLYYTDDKGNIYADKHGLNPTTLEAVTIPAKGHTAGDPVQENVVPPTADRSGSYDEVIYCTVCSVELSRTKKTIPAQGQNTPAPSPTPTPSYGPSAPYVPSTPTVTDIPTGTGTPVSATVSSGEHTSPIKDKYIHAKYDGKKNISLWWDKVDGAKNYTVYIIENGKATALSGTKGTTYTYKKAKAGNIYKFMVKYTTKDGISDKSESYQITVKAEIQKPVVTATVKNGKVTLKWKKVPDATEYMVYRVVNGKLKAVKSTAKTSIVIKQKPTDDGYAVKALINGKWTAVTKSDIVTVTSK